MRTPRVVAIIALLLCACGGEDDAPPPPPVAAPSTVMITVAASSTPSGASVMGGGRLLGMTPFTTQVPAPPAAPGEVQSFSFTFTLAGHRPATVVASPMNGAIALSASLTPEPVAPPVAEPAPPSTPAARPPAPRPTADAIPFRGGESWRGSYVCSQGPTALTLRITSVRGRVVGAVFDFDYRGTSGAFELSGTYDPSSRRISFAPGRWIRRPTGWEPVGMSGSVDDAGQVYSGRITGAPGCTTFRVRR